MSEVATSNRMSARAKPPFRADHVGSFLRPKFLLDARAQFRAGTFDAAQLRRVEDDAIRGIVKFQEDLGLRGITEEDCRHAVGVTRKELFGIFKRWKGEFQPQSPLDFLV